MYKSGKGLQNQNNCNTLTLNITFNSHVYYRDMKNMTNEKRGGKKGKNWALRLSKCIKSESFFFSFLSAKLHKNLYIIVLVLNCGTVSRGHAWPLQSHVISDFRWKGFDHKKLYEQRFLTQKIVQTKIFVVKIMHLCAQKYKNTSRTSCIRTNTPLR